MEENNKVTLKFSYTNEYGETYNAENTYEIYDEITSELHELVYHFNNFLRQVGFIRDNHMLEDDLTFEEYKLLEDTLRDYRAKKLEAITQS